MRLHDQAPPLDTAGHSSGVEHPCCHECGGPTHRVDFRLRRCSKGHLTRISFHRDELTPLACHWQISSGSHLKPMPAPRRLSNEDPGHVAIQAFCADFAADRWA